MWVAIANNIKSIFSSTENAKEFIKFIGEYFQSESADKSLTRTLLITLTNINGLMILVLCMSMSLK